jgi:hypothetical protein
MILSLDPRRIGPVLNELMRGVSGEGTLAERVDWPALSIGITFCRTP